MLVSVLEDASGNAVEITDFAPRFMQLRAHVPSAAARPPRRARSRAATHPRAAAAALRLGRAGPDLTRGSNHMRFVGRRQPCASPPTRRCPMSSRRRPSRSTGRSRSSSAPTSRLRSRDRRDRARIPGATPSHYWQRLGSLALDSVRVAGGRHPRRDHAEALQFRGDRRHRRGAHDLDPRGAGHAAQLGLSLLLAARRLFRHPGAQPPGHHPDDGGLSRLHHQHRRRAEARADPRLPPLYGITRQADLEERIAPALAGLPRHGAGARRQRGLYADAERRLWQRSCWRRPTSSSTSALPAGPCRPCSSIWSALGQRAIGASSTSPMRVRGSCAPRPAVHTFSSVMCWAACDRLARDRQGAWTAPTARRFGRRRPIAMHAVIDARA